MRETVLGVCAHCRREYAHFTSELRSGVHGHAQICIWPRSDCDVYAQIFTGLRTCGHGVRTFDWSRLQCGLASPSLDWSHVGPCQVCQTGVDPLSRPPGSSTCGAALPRFAPLMGGDWQSALLCLASGGVPGEQLHAASPLAA